jgi:hypothetical protein
MAATILTQTWLAPALPRPGRRDHLPATVILDTLLLEPAIQSHFDRSVYQPDVRRECTAANYHLLSHRMFRASADATPERSKP